MDIKIKTWLLDIQQSISEIFEFLGDHRDFFAYQKDLKTNVNLGNSVLHSSSFALKQKKQKFKAVIFLAKNPPAGLKFANLPPFGTASDSANFLTPLRRIFLTPKNQGRSRPTIHLKI